MGRGGREEGVGVELEWMISIECATTLEVLNRTGWGGARWVLGSERAPRLEMSQAGWGRAPRGWRCLRRGCGGR